MARITYVKRAQQRYETVPVIDPETGEQKVVPVMRKDGTPRLTKTGRPVVMRLTREDRTKPKPPLQCEACGEDIQIGTPYKHVTPKSGPYGGHQRNRHATCPDWKPWDLSSAWWARVAQAVDGFDVTDAESPEDVQSALEDLASEIRGLADESREAADNIRDGFGHDTFTSEEADSRADDLESWADEIESVDVPALEDAPCETCAGTQERDCDECSGEGEQDCQNCDGTGTEADGDECGDCEGKGRVTCEGDCQGGGTVDCDECEDGHDLEAWRELVEEAVSITQDSPV